MNTTTKNETTRRKGNETTGRIIRHRLVISVIIAFAVAAIAVVVTALIDPRLWLQSAISSVTVAVPCTIAAIWLAWRINNNPDQAMHAWIITLYVHFITVIAGGLYLTIKMHFHPVPAILVGFLPAMVFVFGNAWIVQALTTTLNPRIRNKSHLENAGLASPLASAQGGSFTTYQSEDPS